MVGAGSIGGRKPPVDKKVAFKLGATSGTEVDIAEPVPEKNGEDGRGAARRWA